jgi:hypothetical protein
MRSRRGPNRRWEKSRSPTTSLDPASDPVWPRRWLARNSTPYRNEIDAVASLVGGSGLHALNISFEWACTTGVAPTNSGGMAMVRVLDWDFDGLGRNLAVIRQGGGAGEWLVLGWPGFAGCITGLAPGRFAAAILVWDDFDALGPRLRHAGAGVPGRLRHGCGSCGSDPRAAGPTLGRVDLQKPVKEVCRVPAAGPDRSGWSVLDSVGYGTLP